MDNDECVRVPTEDEAPEERRFWEKYWEAVRRRGVKPGKEKWYEIHCVRFIRWLRPRRLREALAKDVTEWLRLMASQPDTEGWKLRQADKALRVLFQEMLGMSWAVPAIRSRTGWGTIRANQRAAMPDRIGLGKGRCGNGSQQNWSGWFAHCG